MPRSPRPVLPCLLLLLFVFLLLGRAETQNSRPNILILFTDDQRADGVRALGNPAVETPHLDGLVRRGFVFPNAYCFGGNVGAVCTPSRNMLLSGRTYFRFGRAAPAREPNLPASFRTAGYDTYHHGKRGNTATAIQALFHTNQYVNEQRERNSGEPGRAIADEAIRFLRDRSGRQPFLMYLAFEAPHDPRVAAQPYLDRYRREEIPLPRNYLPLHPFDNGEQTVRDERLAPWPRTEAEIRRHLHEYYAVITGLDHHIGRVLAALEETGQAKNTLILFTSDHGLAMGSHGLMGKQNLYEAGMRVPFVIAGPGIRRGRSPALVYLHDLFPTLCDLAGEPVPTGLDGRSLVPVLRGRQEGVRETLFTAYRDVQRAVRDRRWKLIRYPRIHRTQLFDLRNDPDERRDLAGDPRYRERIEQLRAKLEEWQKDQGDPTPWSFEPRQDETFRPPR